jgi:hypothetical protein
MVSITVGKDTVTIRLQGRKNFLRSRARSLFHFKNITKVSIEKVKPLWLPEIRLRVHLPGIFMAGTFWLKRGETFYYVRDLSNCTPATFLNNVPRS